MDTGLRANESCNAIAEAMVAVYQKWDTLKPADRIKGIADAVLKQLALLSVSPPSVSSKALGKTTAGQFLFRRWVLEISDDSVSEDMTDRVGQVGSLGNTIAHEARHCEQWFRVARLMAEERANKGLTVDAKTGKMIAGELNIPMMPATKAATFVKPLTTAERAEAQKWHRSILGSGAMNRVLVESTFQSLKPVDTKAEVVSDPKLVREIGSLTQTRLFGYYQRDLPYEDDAWAVGAKVEEAFYDKLLGADVRKADALVGNERHVAVVTGLTLPPPLPPRDNLENLPLPDLSALPPPPLPFGKGTTLPLPDISKLPPPPVLTGKGPNLPLPDISKLPPPPPLPRLS